MQKWFQLPESTWIFRRTVTYLGLASISLAGCETITEVDLPVEKPRLVVNSIFNADSLMSVYVTESRPANTASVKFKPVENAHIEVFRNTSSLGFLENKGKGNYRSRKKLEYGSEVEFRIEVEAPGFETAAAVEAIPDKPVLSSFNVTPDYENSNAAYKSYTTTVTLNDANGENYYFLRVWLLFPQKTKIPVNFKLNNNLGQISAPFQSSSEITLFGDKAFNNKSIALNFDIIQAYIPGDGDFTMLIEVGSTTKNYYDYQVSVKKQVDEDPLFSSGENPISNNIQHGLGIFAPYNSATVSFEVVR